MPPTRGACTGSFPGLRYLLLHTFAQILIREFALECGYSAPASLSASTPAAASSQWWPLPGLAHKRTIAGSEQPPLSAADHCGRFLCRTYGDDHRMTPVQPPTSRQRGHRVAAGRPAGSDHIADVTPAHIVGRQPGAKSASQGRRASSGNGSAVPAAGDRAEESR